MLQRRLHSCGPNSVQQLLIKWMGLDSSLTTWEDKEATRQCFPSARHGDMPAPKEGEVSAAHTLETRMM